MSFIQLPHQLTDWESDTKPKIESIQRDPSIITSILPVEVAHLLSPQLVQFICDRALEIGQLFPQGIAALKSDVKREVVINQKQCLCLLAHAFFDTFPKLDDDFQGQRLSFRRFISRGADTVLIEKLKCILLYFRSCQTRMESDSEWKGSLLSVSRKHLLDSSTLPSTCWNSSEKSLQAFTFKISGSIESEQGALQADFANKYIGGGVLGHGCVQEEIRFMISPECLVSLLFCEVMEPYESILIRGTEQFTNYQGYGFSFTCSGDFHDSTPIDAQGFRDNFLVALDAIAFSFDRTHQQYSEGMILRDLNKCYAALFPWDCEQSVPLQDGSLRPFATGNWGCGVFNGDPQLKSILQWAVASQVGRKLIYLPFSDPRVAELPRVTTALLSPPGRVTVGQLCQWMFSYVDESRGAAQPQAGNNNTSAQDRLNFFDYLLAKKGDLDAQLASLEASAAEVITAHDAMRPELLLSGTNIITPPEAAGPPAAAVAATTATAVEVAVLFALARAGRWDELLAQLQRDAGGYAVVAEEPARGADIALAEPEAPGGPMGPNGADSVTDSLKDSVTVMDPLIAATAALKLGHREDGDGPPAPVPIVRQFSASSGDTLLHVAARVGAAEAVLEALLALGCDPLWRNGEGRTPCEVATASDRPEAAALLKRKLDEQNIPKTPRKSSSGTLPSSSRGNSPQSGGEEIDGPHSPHSPQVAVEASEDTLSVDASALASAGSDVGVSICIGDLHGMLKKILLLWAKLEKQLPKHQWETAHVFFLGDYVDKGPDSKGVIEWLSTLHERAPPTQHHHFVIGNHDMAMATFLGLCKDSPGDEAFRATHAYVRAYDKNYLYDGPGANGMHLQGRRWAGQYDIYSSGVTFASYGVQRGDRAGLLAAMPQHHKDFLYNLEWVQDVQTPHGRVIAVHSGIKNTSPADDQIAALKRRNWAHHRPDQLCGRDEMFPPPTDLLDMDDVVDHGADNVYVVSGHHHVLEFHGLNSRRIVIDSCAGHAGAELSAVLLPSLRVVTDGHWHRKVDGGVWQPYGGALNDDIDLRRRQYEEGLAPPTLTIKDGRFQITVDVIAQENQTNGRVRQLKFVPAARNGNTAPADDGAPSSSSSSSSGGLSVITAAVWAAVGDGGGGAGGGASGSSSSGSHRSGRWHYSSEVGFEPFSEENSAKIEAKYKSFLATDVSQVTLVMRGTCYVIDFRAATETELSNGQLRLVRSISQ